MAEPEEKGGESAERFPELAALQQEIEKRIRDNQRFLERFMSDDFADEDEAEEEPGEDFEEL